MSEFEECVFGDWKAQVDRFGFEPHFFRVNNETTLCQEMSTGAYMRGEDIPYMTGKELFKRARAQKQGYMARDAPCDAVAHQ